MTAETCPHYLTFAAEDVPPGATAYKCAPPLRSAANREALWAALDAGGLDSVASDHSPAPPALKLVKEGDFARAWGGIAGEDVSLLSSHCSVAATDMGSAKSSSCATLGAGGLDSFASNHLPAPPAFQ